MSGPIDPRIDGRRREVQRGLRNRRYLKLGVVLVGATLLSVLLALTRSSALDVDRVLVRGADRVTEREVLDVAGIEVGEPMLDVDAAAATSAVEELPWVRSATVGRVWPGTVTIAVEERTPVAAVPAVAGGWALVDADRQVLAPVAEPSDRWVRLEGVTPAGEPGTEVDESAVDALAVAPQFPPAMWGAIAGLARNDSGQLDLRLHNGVVVRLGGPDHFAEKLRATATVFARVERCGLRTVDVRVPDTPTVERHEACRRLPEPPEGAVAGTGAITGATGLAVD